MTQSTPPPPAFYPDPSGVPQERWWDGVAWSTTTRPVPPPAPATAAAERMRPLGTGRDVYRSHQREIDTAVGAGLVAAGVLGLGARGRRSRANLFQAFMGLVFGLGMLGIGGWSTAFLSSGGIDGGATTTATVTVVGLTSDMCTVDAVYEVDGTSYPYTIRRDYASGGRCPETVGSTFEIGYDPADPTSTSEPVPRFMKVVAGAVLAVGALVTIAVAVQIVLRLGSIAVGGSLLLRGGRRRA